MSKKSMLVGLVLMNLAFNTCAMSPAEEVKAALEKARNTKLKGTGTGLFISKEYASGWHAENYRASSFDYPGFYSLEGSSHQVEIRQKLEHHTLMVEANGDTSPLKTALYLSAQKYGSQDNSKPGLYYHNDKDCNTLTGKFNVRQYELDISGNPYKVAIDFEQACQKGEDSGTTTSGVITVNSDLPISPTPALMTNGKLIIPQVKITDKKKGTRYVSAIIKTQCPTYNGMFELMECKYLIQKIIPSILPKDEIKTPAGYDPKRFQLIVPSVVVEHPNGKIFEYEFTFFGNPVDAKEGDSPFLDGFHEIRNDFVVQG